MAGMSHRTKMARARLWPVSKAQAEYARVLQIAREDRRRACTCGSKCILASRTSERKSLWANIVSRAEAESRLPKRSLFAFICQKSTAVFLHGSPQAGLLA